MAHDTPVLAAKNLQKAFPSEGEHHLFHRRMNAAVSDVSFEIYPGETLGLVGESGCGKSTVAKLLMGLEKLDAGEVYLEGQRIDQLSPGRLRPLRPRFQMVFQDSGSSLNPRKRVVDILREPMLYHGVAKPATVQGRIDELLEQVGLPKEMKHRYPHEFSGGQRQRICIARALSLEPKVIVLDEPVSALDVSVQAQILNLLRDLQAEMHQTYLFIGHGLGAVRYISHRIGVMYMGRLVECGDAEELFAHPAHPYTKALLDAVPVADYALRNRPRITLAGEVGEVPSSMKGCPFAPRCPMATSACLENMPELLPFGGMPGRTVACLRAGELR